MVVLEEAAVLAHGMELEAQAALIAIHHPAAAAAAAGEAQAVHHPGLPAGVAADYGQDPAERTFPLAATEVGARFPLGLRHLQTEAATAALVAVQVVAAPWLFRPSRSQQKMGPAQEVFLMRFTAA